MSFDFAEECYYCSNPTECAEESDRTVECIQDNSVCATFTATTEIPEEDYNTGDVLLRNCLILEEVFEGCGVKDNVEICLCEGNLCNDVDMPDKMRGDEEETQDITSRIETIITEVINVVYG